MVKLDKTKALVIASVVLVALGVGYALGRGSRERQSLSQQLQVTLTPLNPQPSRTNTQHGLPDLLLVTHSAAASTHYQPLQKTVSNPAVVQRLYNVILELPPAPTSLQLCPFDTGAEFHLRFFHKNDLILQATAHPGGCRFVSVIGSYTRSTNSGFWALLANALGISESSLISL